MVSEMTYYVSSVGLGFVGKMWIRIFGHGSIQISKYSTTALVEWDVKPYTLTQLHKLLYL